MDKILTETSCMVLKDLIEKSINGSNLIMHYPRLVYDGVTCHNTCGNIPEICLIAVLPDSSSMFPPEIYSMYCIDYQLKG